MEKDILHICLELIAQKINEGESEHWTDGTFIRLAEAIEEQTGIIISRNTLKRLFGKMKTPDVYNPQRETKNALAIFAGYKSWDHLKDEILKDNQFSGLVQPKPGFVQVLKPTEVKHEYFEDKKSRFKFIYIVPGILLACFGIYYCSQMSNSESIPKASATLHILNPIDTVPYTMHVTFETKNVSEDSLFVDGEQIYNNAGKYNMGISTPIYTWLSLKYKKKTLATMPYHAISKGWMSYYQKKNRKSFILIKPPLWKQNGVAAISKKWFQGNSQDSSAFNWFFKKFQKFSYSGR